MLLPSFEPSGNIVIHHPGPGLAPQRHSLSISPYYWSAHEERAPIVSPSIRAPIVDDDWDYLTRDFFPKGFRLDDLQSHTLAGPSTVPAFKLPARPSLFGPPPTIVWPDPNSRRATASFRLPTGAVSWCSYDTYVEGFPHPYSRGSFHPTDKAKQQSGYKYYVVFYGHEVGIYKSWGGVLGTHL